MSDLYNAISALCEQHEITVYKMCKDIGIRGSILSDLNTGRKKGLSTDTLSKIANYFEVSIDELTGRDSTKEKAPTLTKKDERDIAKKLDDMLEQLGGSEDALMFDGEPLDDETRDLLRASLKNQLEMTKRMAKQKYTPKKYKG